MIGPFVRMLQSIASAIQIFQSEFQRLLHVVVACGVSHVPKKKKNPQTLRPAPGRWYINSPQVPKQDVNKKPFWVILSHMGQGMEEEKEDRYFLHFSFKLNTSVSLHYWTYMDSLEKTSHGPCSYQTGGAVAETHVLSLYSFQTCHRAFNSFPLETGRKVISRLPFGIYIPLTFSTCMESMSLAGRKMWL